MMTIDKALRTLEAFQGASLTKSLSDIERCIIGSGLEDVDGFCTTRGIDGDFMDSAIAVKRVASQINVIIHAAGILSSLSGVLEPGERVESVSLGAGNTGRQFDLETNMRVAEYKFIDWQGVAEYKFIDWQGGAESIRQNGIFKDFYALAEHETFKKKYLYVVGTDYPLKFFNGGRALTSVLSRHPKVLAHIHEKYGVSIAKVCDYFELKKNEVFICDVTPYIGRSA